MTFFENFLVDCVLSEQTPKDIQAGNVFPFVEGQCRQHEHDFAIIGMGKPCSTHCWLNTTQLQLIKIHATIPNFTMNSPSPNLY